MSKTTAHGFGQILVQAGVLTQDEAGMTRRIVIDCTDGHGVMVYVERYADSESLVRLAPMLRDIIPPRTDTPPIPTPDIGPEDRPRVIP